MLIATINCDFLPFKTDKYGTKTDKYGTENRQIWDGRTDKYGTENLNKIHFTKFVFLAIITTYI